MIDDEWVQRWYVCCSSRPLSHHVLATYMGFAIVMTWLPPTTGVIYCTPATAKLIANELHVKLQYIVGVFVVCLLVLGWVGILAVEHSPLRGQVACLCSQNVDWPWS